MISFEISTRPSGPNSVFSSRSSSSVMAATRLFLGKDTEDSGSGFWTYGGFPSHALFSLQSSPEQRLLVLFRLSIYHHERQPGPSRGSLLLAFPHIILDALLDKVLQPHESMTPFC
jgi:hypothetical protein